MKINKMIDLKKLIQRTIDGMEDDEEKNIEIINYNSAMEYPDFIITIQKKQLDHYIDANGNKWVKCEKGDQE